MAPSALAAPSPYHVMSPFDLVVVPASKVGHARGGVGRVAAAVLASVAPVAPAQHVAAVGRNKAAAAKGASWCMRVHGVKAHPYCTKGKHHTPHAPRTAAAVPQVEKEHWTMSVMGVVHVTQGEDKEAEFMELGEWIRCASSWCAGLAALHAAQP